MYNLIFCSILLLLFCLSEILRLLRFRNSKEMRRCKKVASALRKKIKSADLVLIMGHKFSDFDSIGAAVGFWSVCRGTKKSHVIVNKSHTLAGFTIKHIEENVSVDAFISPEEAEKIATPKTLLIIVDTHAVNFLENPKLCNIAETVVVIDHHGTNINSVKNAAIFYHEPSASSTCEMVTELIRYMGDKNLKKAEAECLLAGIMLDTKDFSLRTEAKTFEAAAYLKRKGADNAQSKKMFANSIDTYKIRCKIISSTKIVENCGIARFEDDATELRVPCAQAADELLNVHGIQASFVIFQFGDMVGVSARSSGDVNVQMIMESLGGGGHQTMAAAQIEDSSIDEVENKLNNMIKSLEKISKE